MPLIEKGAFNGKTLYHLRVNAGMSLLDLQKITGLTIATLSNLENGVFQPQPKTLRKLSKAFKKDPSYFYGEVAGNGGEK